MKNESVIGKHVAHSPTFSQRNGHLALFEYIDFGTRRVNKVKERAGWMAYMFSDVRALEPDCVSYSILRPERASVGAVEYAKSLLGGESKLVNWANEAEREAFLAERRLVAESI
jgi:hypothetical protein